jgi:hypothetical protein
MQKKYESYSERQEVSGEIPGTHSVRALSNGDANSLHFFNPGLHIIR